jgi:hypothetical protein
MIEESRGGDEESKEEDDMGQMVKADVDGVEDDVYVIVASAAHYGVGACCGCERVRGGS